MRTVLTVFWLATIFALGVNADESASEPSPEQAPESTAAGSAPAEQQTEKSQAATEAAAEADIRRIEQGVSGAGEVKEFIPKKPLSADKAIALPSDI